MDSHVCKFSRLSAVHYFVEDVVNRPVDSVTATLDREESLPVSRGSAPGFLKEKLASVQMKAAAFLSI